MLRIAVCEDHPITAEEICQKIKQYSPMDAQILSFSDADAILSAIREYTFIPHIVFMDIELQTASGIQTAKNITSLLPDCQIIYLTNYMDYASQVYETSHIFFYFKEGNGRLDAKGAAESDPLSGCTGSLLSNDPVRKASGEDSAEGYPVHGEGSPQHGDPHVTSHLQVSG